MHRRLALLILVLTACGTGDGTSTYVRTTDPPDDDDDDSATAGCDGPILEIHNDSRIAFTRIDYGTCDMQTGLTYPLLPDGLGPGESRTIELPAPDCYFIVISEDSDCELDGPIQTGPLDACELFKIVVTDDPFICPGG
jgi:hypothetical protein